MNVAPNGQNNIMFQQQDIELEHAAIPVEHAAIPVEHGEIKRQRQEEVLADLEQQPAEVVVLSVGAQQKLLRQAEQHVSLSTELYIKIDQLYGQVGNLPILGRPVTECRTRVGALRGRLITSIQNLKNSRGDVTNAQQQEHTNLSVELQAAIKLVEELQAAHRQRIQGESQGYLRQQVYQHQDQTVQELDTQIQRLPDSSLKAQLADSLGKRKAAIALIQLNEPEEDILFRGALDKEAVAIQRIQTLVASATTLQSLMTKISTLPPALRSEFSRSLRTQLDAFSNLLNVPDDNPDFVSQHQTFTQNIQFFQIGIQERENVQKTLEQLSARLGTLQTSISQLPGVFQLRLQQQLQTLNQTLGRLQGCQSVDPTFSDQVQLLNDQIQKLQINIKNLQTLENLATRFRGVTAQVQGVPQDRLLLCQTRVTTLQREFNDFKGQENDPSFENRVQTFEGHLRELQQQIQPAPPVVVQGVESAWLTKVAMITGLFGICMGCLRRGNLPLAVMFGALVVVGIVAGMQKRTPPSLPPVIVSFPQLPLPFIGGARPNLLDQTVQSSCPQTYTPRDIELQVPPAGSLNGNMVASLHTCLQEQEIREQILVKIGNFCYEHLLFPKGVEAFAVQNPDAATVQKYRFLVTLGTRFRQNKLTSNDLEEIRKALGEVRKGSLPTNGLEIIHQKNIRRLSLLLELNHFMQNTAPNAQDVADIFQILHEQSPETFPTMEGSDPVAIVASLLTFILDGDPTQEMVGNSRVVKCSTQKTPNFSKNIPDYIIWEMNPKNQLTEPHALLQNPTSMPDGNGGNRGNTKSKKNQQPAEKILNAHHSETISGKGGKETTFQLRAALYHQDNHSTAALSPRKNWLLQELWTFCDNSRPAKKNSCNVAETGQRTETVRKDLPSTGLHLMLSKRV